LLDAVTMTGTAVVSVFRDADAMCTRTHARDLGGVHAT